MTVHRSTCRRLDCRTDVYGIPRHERLCTIVPRLASPYVLRPMARPHRVPLLPGSDRPGATYPRSRSRAAAASGSTARCRAAAPASVRPLRSAPARARSRRPGCARREGASGDRALRESSGSPGCSDALPFGSSTKRRPREARTRMTEGSRRVYRGAWWRAIAVEVGRDMDPSRWQVCDRFGHALGRGKNESAAGAETRAALRALGMRLRGFEPLASASGGQRSIQLSYRRECWRRTSETNTSPWGAGSAQRTGARASRTAKNGSAPTSGETGAERARDRKPSSVPARAGRIISLRPPLPAASSSLPGTRLERAAPRPLFGLAPGGVCRAARVTASPVRSYRTLSPLPVRRANAGHRRSALCCTFRRSGRPRGSPERPGVTRHPALWSSDFPPAARPCRPEDRHVARRRSSHARPIVLHRRRHGVPQRKRARRRAAGAGSVARRSY
jgi:hypothetical protein